MENARNLTLLASLTEQAGDIVIITHEHPDGDAAGSSSALYEYLRFKGKTSITMVREELPQTLAFIDPAPTVYGEEAVAAIAKADLILCTDFCDPARCGYPSEALLASNAKKVLFDHHIGPQEDKFDLVFSKTDISSASEVVYYILKGLCADERQRKALFSGRCGFCLMCGMTTDTNNFSCATFPSTLQMAGELLSYGVDRDYIISEIYNRYRENRVRAFAYILSDRLTIREDGIAVIKVSRETWHRFGLKEGELENLVNVPLSIDKVKVSIYLREDTDTVRVSIRSKKGWSARALAGKYFHGGGHELASGGKLFLGQDIARFEELDAYLEKVTL